MSQDDHALSTAHAWLLAATIFGLFLLAVAAIYGAGNNANSWVGALYLGTGVLSLTSLARILSPR